MSLGNGILKQQCNVPTPIRMHKIQKTNNIKDWQGWEATEACINLLMEMHNSSAAQAISYKANDNLIGPSNHVPRYLPRWSEILCLHKNLPMSIRTSLVQSCQKLEASKTYVNKRVDTKTVKQPYNAILLSDKKKWAIESQENMNEP